MLLGVIPLKKPFHMMNTTKDTTNVYICKCVTGSKNGMEVEYPLLADGRAHSDVPSSLARDIHNSPMANYVPPPSPSFGQVKSSLINKDNLMGNRPAFNLCKTHETQ